MPEIEWVWSLLLAAARGASLDALGAAAADPLVALYLPLCRGRPLTIGHLAQSLDGFVATRGGESLFITGDENVVHMHRLRALSDAVVVGASTVLADDSRLTTRRVPGPNPLRVVIDPRRRLPVSLRLFSDGAAPTLLICDAAHAQPGERFGGAEVVGLPARDGRLDYAAILDLLHGRSCRTVFVEGGGATVSGFLAAGLLDRLQITVAPALLGDGLPSLRMPAAPRLADARSFVYRMLRMGDDVLFDCELRAVQRAS
jgi:diaminohydroxyphosphoribosylaminopyrimidine deaminase / 5-amino-6-(5-phosphoribosylamino)uracil reductase